MRTERQLLLAMHRGHEPSAEELWGRLAPRLLAYARAVLPRGAGSAPEDVVQGVFCSVLERPRRELRRVEDPVAWLFRLTRNHALNLARTDSREKTRREEHRTLTAAASDADTEAVRDVTDRLPEEQREVVLLRHAGGLTFDQIAEALGVNRNTVAGRHRRAVATLQESLAASRQEAPSADA